MGNYKIDHVALAVQELEPTVRLYTETLGFRQIYRETLPDIAIEAVGMEAGDSLVELMRPLDESSPIAGFCGTAPTKLHHIAYRVNDLAAELARLRAEGVRIIDETPRKGAHGNTISFLHPKDTGGVLIELCQPPG